MNQRYKQLLAQAHIVLNPPGTYSRYDNILPEQMERFVQLMVKECGVALSPMLRDMISRGQAYNLIQEHFGVDR